MTKLEWQKECSFWQSCSCEKNVQDSCHQWSTWPDPQFRSPVVNIVFTWNLSCFARFWKVETDGRTDKMYENNDHYRPWLWVGRVDELGNFSRQCRKKKEQIIFFSAKLQFFSWKKMLMWLEYKNFFIQATTTSCFFLIYRGRIGGVIMGHRTKKNFVLTLLIKL